MTEYLFHLTSPETASEILARGLPRGALLLRNDVAKHHAERLHDLGQQIVALRIPASAALAIARPDGLAMANPADNGLARSEEDIFVAWARSDGSAGDSLRIVGSVRLRSPAPRHMLERTSTPMLEQSRGVGLPGGKRQAGQARRRPPFWTLLLGRLHGLHPA